MREILVPTEAQEQRALFEWIAFNEKRYPGLGLCFHIPNGGSRDPREARNLRLQGVKPGVPDICLPVARKGYHGLYIELKRRQGGRASEEQRQWINALNENGYLAWVCKGAEDAIDLITEYLSDGNNTTLQGL